MSTLPPLADVHARSPGALAQALTVLFEASPTLTSHLVPHLAASDDAPPSYAHLVDLALAAITQWDDALQAEFVAGHPRIGEVNGLSKLSAKEQAAAATPPAVLARLQHLNACYERRYPGLRYITFVNGRSRSAIMEEMEDKLGFARSLSAADPPIESVEIVDVGGKAWKAELDRAVQDVGRIAKSRLKALGVE